MRERPKKIGHSMPPPWVKAYKRGVNSQKHYFDWLHLRFRKLYITYKEL